MSEADMKAAMDAGTPYFGPFMACRKSWPHIYWYQQKLMKLVSESWPRDRLSILEIGSWAGASAYSWCEGIRRYFDGKGAVICVDVWAEDQSTSYGIKDVFLHNIRAGDCAGLVEPLQMPSDQAFETLDERNFDLIYIDGDHAYGQVHRDIQHAIDLLEVGGILCGDDLEVQAAEIPADVLRRDSRPSVL